MNDTATAAPVGRHTRAFNEWITKEKANGLIDLKFFFGDIRYTDQETFAAEALRALTAPEVPSPHGFF
jgi:hypothetical protein